MTDVELVLRKLARLREFVERARRRLPANAGVLATDTDRADALALAVLVATQEAIDVAMHVAADEGWTTPASQREALESLSAHGVIAPEDVSALAAVVRVRNRIAHGYGSVDHERLARELPGGLGALDAYASSVARWLAGRS